jgi:hypothetical protein
MMVAVGTSIGVATERGHWLVTTAAVMTKIAPLPVPQQGFESRSQYREVYLL